MTHTELVTRASHWLQKSIHCRVVLSELVAYTLSGETPDAIGWVAGKCILVEVKSSRRDYYADRKKRSRNYGRALGDWRFYLTPPGLLTGVIMPDGWGLYEVHGGRIKHITGEKYCNAGKPPFQSDRESEIAMLVSALARTNTRS